MSSLKSSASFTDFSSIFRSKEFHLANIRGTELKKIYIYRSKYIYIFYQQAYDIEIALNLSLAVKICEYGKKKRFYQLRYAI